MSKGDEPAYPKTGQCSHCFGGGLASGGESQCLRCGGLGSTQEGGLTKHELFAAMAMQGMMNHWSTQGILAPADGAITMPEIVADAVEFADLLVAELAKEKPCPAE